MVRDSRIKNYTFSIANLTANASGTLSVYSDHPLNGTIHKIIYHNGNYAANGSLSVNISGAVEETVWYYKNAVANQTAYPVVFGVDVNNVTGSPAAVMPRTINSTLRIVASGVGAAASGLGLTVYYI